VAQVGAQVGAQVRAQVGDQVWDQVGDQVRAQVGTAIYGKEEAGWLGWVSYMRDVLKLVKETEKMVGLIELSENASWIYPYKNIAIISEKPKTINMFNGRLHCETGPSIEYPDGFRVYSLNGIRMPEWAITKTAEEIDPKDIMKEQNVEIRRELFRKVGIQRIYDKLNSKMIDKRDGYELVDFDFGNSITGRYLKMTNPSVGLIHIEGVTDDCDTIDKALMFRNRSILKVINGGKKWQNPETLT